MKLFSILLMLLIAGCASQPITSEKSSIPPIAMQSATKKHLMNAMFSNFNEKNDYSDWICKDSSLLRHFNVQSDSTLIRSKLLLIDSVLISNGKYLLVIIDAKPASIDFPCSPIQWGYIFKAQENKWLFEKRQLISQLGNWGNSPEITVKKIGANHNAYFIESGITNQGFTEVSLLCFSFLNGTFTCLLNLPDAYTDNFGNCDSVEKKDCYETNFSYQLLPAGKEYYDLSVRKYGNHFDTENLNQNFDSTLIFKFNCSSFKRVN